MGDPIDYEKLTVDFAYPLQTRGRSYYIADTHRYFASKNIYHCGRGGSFDYCNGDKAFLQGKAAADKVMSKLESVSEPNPLTFTVGIPSYMSGHSLVKTVRSLRESRGVDDFEIVLAVDGSMDQKVEGKLKKYKVKIFKNKGRGGQTAANNRLMNFAKTDLLILTQDDVVFDKYALKEMINSFAKDPELTMVAPRIWPLNEKVKFEKVVNTGVRIVRNISKSWSEGDNYLSSIGRCLAYRTNKLSEFVVDEKIINCDAYYYFENKRLGGIFKYLDNAVVYYRSPQTLDEHLKQVRKFVVSQEEMSKYLEMDLNEEYKTPKKLFVRSMMKEIISSPFYALAYLLISIYVRTRPKNFYKEVTRFWDIDKSTKQTVSN
jgi:cellulose synthase/poly-beta-1,6-N-acetylglucosamine synthase-like glycosyltransferase